MPQPQHLLVIADSLAYHGPDRPCILTEQRLWPNVLRDVLRDHLASEFGEVTSLDVDLVARLGWTARDAWWAVTKDPYVWGAVLPRADALVLAVGGMDHLPAAIPTYLRDGIPYVRPGGVRRKVRDAYRKVSPPIIRLTDGRLRQLPQAATDHYLSRITHSARFFNPQIPIVLVAPGIHNSPEYPSDRHHVSAVSAARQWARDHNAGYVEIDDLIRPSLLDGTANPDGIHYSWRTHELIGIAVAKEMREVGFGDRGVSLALSGE